MSYGYDEQLIDAVAVRRRRLESALMFGEERLRRAWLDRTRSFVHAAFIAVIAAAACVAISFVTNLLANDDTLRNRSTPLNPASSVSPGTPSSPGSSAGPTGAP